MKNSKGYHIKFRDLMIDEATRRFSPSITSDVEVQEALANIYFDLDGPRAIKKVPDNDMQFFGEIFMGFVEIETSLSTLEDIILYVGRFPFRKSSIKKERYLRFCIEAYLNENFLLKERLKSYPAIVEKKYKRDTNIKATTQKIISHVVKSFEYIVKIRNVHVHENRRFSDPDLDRLSLLDILSSRGNIEAYDSIIRKTYEMSYRKTRIKWKETMEKNIINLREFLDGYFYDLSKILFDENGILIFPQNFNRRN